MSHENIKTTPHELGSKVEEPYSNFMQRISVPGVSFVTRSIKSKYYFKSIQLDENRGNQIDILIARIVRSSYEYCTDVIIGDTCTTLFP
jgi:hypothetical protein